MPPTPNSTRRRGALRVPGRGRHAFVLRLATTLAIAVFGLVGFASVAQANQYNGLLTSSVYFGSGGQSVSAGFVYGNQSWTLPDGMQFGGFAYTGATFSSSTDEASGGVSAGFVGTGGNAPATLMFPWTNDCAITNSGKYWANGGASESGASTAGADVDHGLGNSCYSNGSTGGWNYDNSEVESSTPAANPQTVSDTQPGCVLPGCVMQCRNGGLSLCNEPLRQY